MTDQELIIEIGNRWEYHCSMADRYLEVLNILREDTPLIEPVTPRVQPEFVEVDISKLSAPTQAMILNMDLPAGESLKQTEIIPEIIPKKQEEIFHPEPTPRQPLETGIPVTGIPVTGDSLKVCVNPKCGKPFIPKTKKSKYCSSKCYQQDYMHEYWKNRTQDKGEKVKKKSLAEYVKSVTKRTEKAETVTKEPEIVPEEPIIVIQPVVGIASVIEPPSCALCHKPTVGRRHIIDQAGNEFCNSDCQTGWNILHKSDSDVNGGTETKEQIHERIMKYEREHPLPKSPQRR